MVEVDEVGTEKDGYGDKRRLGRGRGTRGGKRGTVDGDRYEPVMRETKKGAVSTTTRGI